MVSSRMYVIRISVYRVLLLSLLLTCIFCALIIFLQVEKKYKNTQSTNSNSEIYLLVDNLKEVYNVQSRFSNKPNLDLVNRQGIDGRGLEFSKELFRFGDLKEDNLPPKLLKEQNQPLIIHEQEVSKLKSDEQIEAEQETHKLESSIPNEHSIIDLKKHTVRKNLIIFGHDRSGTTFLNHVFNHDSEVFTTYEPLGLTRAWHKDFAIVNMTEAVLEVLQSFMTCQFSGFPHTVRLLQQFSSLWRIRSHSRVLMSQPFCTQPGEITSCTELYPSLMDPTCSQHKHSVVKIRTFNIPHHKISSLVSLLRDTPDVENAILHLVRDPRAAINSRINWGDLPDYEEKHFKGWTEEICEEMYNNVLTGKDIQGRVKKKYKILKYRELFSSPLEMVQEIYDFAGFGIMSNAVKEWIISATQPSSEILEKALKDPFSPVRNSSVNIDRWRSESPPERIKIIENVCKPIMDLLGYTSMTTEQ